MKLFILLIIFLSFPNGDGQLACDIVREGKFNIPIPLPDYEGHYTYLERKGPYQIETSSLDSSEVQYRVSWLDDCTYVLFNRKILKGEDKYPHKPSDSLTVTITNVTDSYYESVITSNFADMKLEAKIFIDH